MKVWNYMIIMLVLMIVLNIFGLSTSNGVLSDIGTTINSTTGEIQEYNLQNSRWYSNLFNATDGLIIVAGAGAALIIGFITKTFDWKLAVAGFFTSFVIKFVSVGWSIMNIAASTSQDWLMWIIGTIFIPLTAMFIFSVVEWFGGND